MKIYMPAQRIREMKSDVVVSLSHHPPSKWDRMLPNCVMANHWSGHSKSSSACGRVKTAVRGDVNGRQDFLLRWEATWVSCWTSLFILYLYFKLYLLIHCTFKNRRKKLKDNWLIKWWGWKRAKASLLLKLIGVKLDLMDWFLIWSS